MTTFAFSKAFPHLEKLWNQLREDQKAHAFQLLKSWGWDPKSWIPAPAMINAAQKALRNRP